MLKSQSDCSELPEVGVALSSPCGTRNLTPSGGLDGLPNIAIGANDLPMGGSFQFPPC